MDDSMAGAGLSPIDKKNRLQEQVMQALIADGTPVTVFLTGGVKLNGRIGAQDAFTILLIGDRGTNMIYKSSVAAVVPKGTVELTGEGWTQGVGERPQSRPGKGSPEKKRSFSVETVRKRRSV